MHPLTAISQLDLAPAAKEREAHQAAAQKHQAGRFRYQYRLQFGVETHAARARRGEKLRGAAVQTEHRGAASRIRDEAHGFDGESVQAAHDWIEGAG